MSSSDQAAPAPGIKTAFPPIINEHSQVLILGSMPGDRSLDEQAYYAHPRNAFWWIMSQLIGVETQWPYAQRLNHLQDHKIALWDVLHRCERPGSLDSAIVQDSVEANDFEQFLGAYPHLRALFFNGRTVANLFQRHVVRGRGFTPHIPCHVLPSTSPANARMKPAQKLEQWRGIQDYLET